MSEYDALYAHAGGSPQALQAIDGLTLHDMNALTGDGRFYYREASKVAPHNLFTSHQLLTLALRDKQLEQITTTYDSWLFQEDATADSIGKEQFVEIDFNSGPLYKARYEYQPVSNTYTRFTGGVEHIDANTADPIQVTNVIIQIVPPGIAEGGEGRTNYQVTGSGEAYIVRGGRVIEGTWSKQDREARTVFLDSDGEFIPLNQGSTWISILPSTGSIDYN